MYQGNLLTLRTLARRRSAAPYTKMQKSLQLLIKLALLVVCHCTCKLVWLLASVCFTMLCCCFFVEREDLWKTRAVKFLSFFIFANSSFLTIAADLCKRVMF